MTSVDIAEDRSVVMTMLFDAGHSLDERILAGTIPLLKPAIAFPRAAIPKRSVNRRPIV